MTTAAESEPTPRIAGTGRRSAWIAGLAVAAAWLVVAIALLPRYGPTIDEAVGEIPYGEGLLHACEAPDVTLEETLVHPRAAPARAPHPDFVFDQPWTDVWPFGAFLSALSCRACWTEAGQLGAVAAHHLPVPLLVAPLLVVMVLWSARRIGLLAGLGAALGLLASPRFFADAISNLKDGPEAVLYVLAWLAGDGGGLPTARRLTFCAPARYRSRSVGENAPTSTLSKLILLICPFIEPLAEARNRAPME
jgi:hypothetical protein